jgi:beta-aspartyl-peptidase (threonine type)
MDETRHVLLAGRSAERLARRHGLEIVKRDYFRTRRRWEALQRVKRQLAHGRLTEADRHGTVGAVALDAHGNLAAATSTGGYTNKLAGRIGDSPIIGAGTYASNFSAAVSCTGEGEHFMRGALAHTLCMLMELKRWSVTRAAKHVIHSILTRRGGTGGLIALDRGGRIAMPFNTPGMYRGVVRAGGVPRVAIYDDSTLPR